MWADISLVSFGCQSCDIVVVAIKLLIVNSKVKRILACVFFQRQELDIISPFWRGSNV